VQRSVFLSRVVYKIPLKLSVSRPMWDVLTTTAATETASRGLAAEQHRPLASGKIDLHVGYNLRAFLWEERNHKPLK